MTIKSFKLETVFSRAVLIIAGVFCLSASFIFVKWCFANAIAAHAINNEIAELTVSTAPDDPQTHYAVAVLNEKTFSVETLEKSRSAFGRATALSPNDFRLWLAYGKALERGDQAGAELALKKALSLAPNYAAVQWAFGNALLRKGKTPEGFDEMRRAADSDPNYRLPTISIAWQIFDGNLDEVKRAVGASANLRSMLTAFLAGQKRLDEAVEIWNSLPLEDRKTIYKADGTRLLVELTAAKRFRKALEIQNDFSEKSDAEKFAVGKIHNGGFETELTRERASAFDWQIADGLQPQIGPNEEQKHGGSRSIFIIFNSNNGRDFRQVSQTVAVEPSRKYVFNGFYKSNLKTIATLRWEIVDAATGAVLASNSPIAANADWTNFTVPFAVADGTEAVVVRLAREPCKSIICPVYGSVWFDDFSISQ